MQIAEVVGTVTLSRSALSPPARLKLVVPLSLAELAGGGRLPAEEFVVFDKLGAGIGSRIAVSEGREAAMPFYPDVKPVDAYNAAILDEIQVDADQLHRQ